MVQTKVGIKVADEVFIATALLHREQPDRHSFTINEIVERVAHENLFGSVRKGVRVHATSHCVANRKPDPATYRMLYAPQDSARRLLTPGDDIYPGRTGKIFPELSDIPVKYHDLVNWARQRYGATTAKDEWLAGIRKLRGLGRQIWSDEHSDDYVRRLREGWE